MNPYILNTLIYLALAIAALCVGAGLFAITEHISLRREAKRDRDKFRRRFATGCRPLMVLMLLFGAVPMIGQDLPVKDALKSDGELVPFTTAGSTTFKVNSSVLIGGIDYNGNYFLVNSKGVEYRCTKAQLIVAVKRDKRLTESVRSQALTYLGVPRGLKIYGEAK